MDKEILSAHCTQLKRELVALDRQIDYYTDEKASAVKLRLEKEKVLEEIKKMLK